MVVKDKRDGAVVVELTTQELRVIIGALKDACAGTEHAGCRRLIDELDQLASEGRGTCRFFGA
jgi:hypothetical protein